MPRKVTVESERKERCDLIVERAVALMVEGGAPLEVVIDRLLSYGAAQACLTRGSVATAKVFRQLADNIEDGVFHSLTGESGRQH